MELEFYFYIVVFVALIVVMSVIGPIYDKKNAKRRKKRMPEMSLFSIAILGGSLPMFITMLLIHHKTRKKRFMLGLPLIFILQVILLVVALQNS